MDLRVLTLLLFLLRLLLSKPRGRNSFLSGEGLGLFLVNIIITIIFIITFIAQHHRRHQNPFLSGEGLGLFLVIVLVKCFINYRLSIIINSGVIFILVTIVNSRMIQISLASLRIIITISLT